MRLLHAITLAVPAGALSLAAPAPAPVRAPTSRAADPIVWKIDINHSELTFRIRHFTSRVSGQFRKWEGTITSPSATSFDGGSVAVTIDATTIDTNNERRDSDLRSEEHFDVAKYPTVTFKSTKAEVKGAELTLWGELTIKATTKPVVIKGKYNGIANDGRGGERAGFEGSVTINRLEYDLKWNRAVEGSGLMLGDEVTIDIAIEAIRVPPARP
jgi:polyisoprenoid-binding protein YceI